MMLQIPKLKAHRIFVGVPGGGKTTSMLRYISNEIDYDPTLFMASSFMRRHTYDLKRKLKEATGMNEKALSKVVLTFDSIAWKYLFREYGINPVENNNRLQSTLKRFFRAYNMCYSSYPDPLALPEELPPGNRIYNAFENSLKFFETPDDVVDICKLEKIYPYLSVDTPLDKLIDIFYSLNSALLASGALTYSLALHTAISDQLRLTEFADSLEFFVYDEVNDATILHSRFVETLLHDTQIKLIMGGQEQQAIFSLMGGTPEVLSQAKGKRILLSKSWRFSNSLVSFARKIERKCGFVAEKWQGNDRVTTTIRRIGYHHLFELASKEHPLQVLTRTRRQAIKIQQEALLRGIPCIFSRRGEKESKVREEIVKFNRLVDFVKTGKLTKTVRDMIYVVFSKDLDSEPFEVYRIRHLILQTPRFFFMKYAAKTQLSSLQRMFWNNVAERFIWKRIEVLPIVVSTAHSSKGMEFENVAVFFQKTQSMMRSLVRHPPLALEMHRVAFVMATRAKKNLYLIECVDGYDWPKIL